MRQRDNAGFRPKRHFFTQHEFLHNLWVNDGNGEAMQTRSSSSSTTTVLIVLLVIFTFPLWIGLLGGMIGLIAGAFGAAIGIVAGVFGAVIGGLGAAVGWIFDWNGPWDFHAGFWTVRTLTIIAIVVAIVFITRRR